MYPITELLTNYSFTTFITVATLGTIEPKGKQINTLLYDNKMVDGADLGMNCQAADCQYWRSKGVTGKVNH